MGSLHVSSRGFRALQSAVQLAEMQLDSSRQDTDIGRCSPFTSHLVMTSAFAK
jgi:hypothetical protein